MKVKPCAGNPAEGSSLVNVPRLVTTHYAEGPDPHAQQRVTFGTSVHRGSSSATFNEWHILAITQANCLLLDVPVSLGGLDPAAVRVEVYADGVAGKEPVRKEMKQERSDGGSGGFVYSASVPAVRPAADCTVRITRRRCRGSSRVQSHPLAAVTCERA